MPGPDPGLTAHTGKETTAAAAASAAATRQQEDAQEFLGFLLDSAHEELLRLRLLHAASLGNPGARISASFKFSSLSSPFCRALLQVCKDPVLSVEHSLGWH